MRWQTCLQKRDVLFLLPSRELFVSNIPSIHRAKASSIWRVPLAYDYYAGNSPGLSLQTVVTRSIQRALVTLGS
ncbi:hypothetical protein TNIN_74901 [Trichonephila inaurata madagascariensis]|uniref:Uncharacterized protein n=1 Tax=Trichonephila inaurata madagascariensis TaxID=2747483 RepID=A0A8X6WQJ1_9ARAC|nr:hypothetical protein TNIN_74901 [Trichonephila inaurata madagascariensis]